jgi:hypothetical protein
LSLGLTAVLIQVQKAFKTGIKQNTITDAGRSIMDMITATCGRCPTRKTPTFSRAHVFNFFWGAPNCRTLYQLRERRGHPHQRVE